MITTEDEFLSLTEYDFRAMTRSEIEDAYEFAKQLLDTAQKQAVVLRQSGRPSLAHETKLKQIRLQYSFLHTYRCLPWYIASKLHTAAA